MPATATATAAPALPTREAFRTILAILTGKPVGRFNSTAVAQKAFERFCATRNVPVDLDWLQDAFAGFQDGTYSADEVSDSFNAAGPELTAEEAAMPNDAEVEPAADIFPAAIAESRAQADADFAAKAQAYQDDELPAPAPLTERKVAAAVAQAGRPKMTPAEKLEAATAYAISKREAVRADQAAAIVAKATAPKAGTMKRHLFDMMCAPGGATNAELRAASGWMAGFGIPAAKMAAEFGRVLRRTKDGTRGARFELLPAEEA